MPRAFAHPTRAAAVTAIAISTILVGSLSASPAYAAATLQLTLTQTTGTTPFDAAAGAGNDTSASDEIVRTNDTVAYKVGIRYEGDASQTNPTITFTLPEGEELVSLPPFCLSGSSVTPASLGAPVLPLSSTSYLDLGQQTVVCRVAGENPGTALDYTFAAKVRSEVPNGVALGPITAAAASDQVTTPVVSNEVAHIVSAAAKYDLSKRNASTTDNSGPLYQATQACAFDNARSCMLVSFPLTITAPNNAKGVSPLVSTVADPITFTDDISPNAFYGAGTTSTAAWLAAADPLTKYAPRLVSCNVLATSGNALPAKSGGGTTAVSNSGTVTCAQPGGLGTPVEVSIVGADMSAYSVPTRTADNSAALPADLAYLVSTSFMVEIPTDAILDLGVNSNNIWTLNWSNVFGELSGVDISGQENVDPVPDNDTRVGQSTLRTTGSFDKFFTGVTGDSGNTPGSQYSLNIFDGPPGSGLAHDGNTVVLPGQTVMSTLYYVRYLPPGSGTTYSQSTLLCDAWDPAAFALAPGNYRGFQDKLNSGGDAAFVWNYYYNTQYQTSLAGLDNFSIQYGSGAFGPGAVSACDTGTWYDDPADVPGAVLQADGTYSGVNRVRATLSDKASTDSDLMAVGVNIALRVLDTYEVGDYLPNYTAQKVVDGVNTPAEIIAADDDTTLSAYDFEANTGKFGDRLILGAAIARLTKEVRNPTSGEFTGTAVPQYTAGNNVDYRISPTLTADVPAGTFADVVVEDCLPKYQQFVSAVRASGAAVLTVVSDGSPAGGDLTCPAGQTHLAWDLGSNEIGSDIDPIIYSVQLLETVRNGTYTNTALVSADGDPSAATLRDDTAQIQVVVPTGIKISKSVPQTIVELNPTDVTTPRVLEWNIEFANIDSPTDVANVDVIDVLPSDGLGGSDFAGTLALTDVTTSGSGIEVLRTSRPSAQLSIDPLNATNLSAGSTVWCNSSNAVVSGSGTSADCPSTLAQVTGLRFLRPGDFEPEDTFGARILMVPLGNAGGDVYVNATSGRADGVSQQVGPASRAIAIVESSIGDFVWEDLNANGIQDAGEPGIAGFPVSISGTDVDGNAVSRSTVTDADGLYEFAGLASGEYRVTFDPEALDSNSSFSPQDQGSDDTIDSDGDPVTGQTALITLPRDTTDLTWDQGVIIDRNVQLSVAKRLVSATEPDSNRKVTVVYEIVVANAGTASSEYTLEDELQYGGGITVDKATVANTAPGGILTASNWDGITEYLVASEVPIAGGATHTYEVVVEATLTTKVTAASADCVLTSTESGTGYLNTAILSFEDTVVDDSACGASPQLPAKPLASTGSGVPFGGAFAGVVLALAGLALYLSRRRREAL